MALADASVLEKKRTVCCSEYLADLFLMVGIKTSSFLRGKEILNYINI